MFTGKETITLPDENHLIEVGDSIILLDGIFIVDQVDGTKSLTLRRATYWERLMQCTRTKLSRVEGFFRRLVSYFYLTILSLEILSFPPYTFGQKVSSPCCGTECKAECDCSTS